MYDFSGILYRIYATDSILLLLGIVLLILNKLIYKRWFPKKKDWYIVLILLVALSYMIWHTSIIISPNVESFTGEFVKKKRDSRPAPPLPYTSCYTFSYPETPDRKRGFYIDSFSSKKIFPEKLEVGKTYTIHYDKSTKVIVRVDVANSQVNTE